MSDEAVMVEIPLEFIMDMRAALIACAQDVIINAEHTYPVEQREQYPTYARRYRGEIEIASQALIMADGFRGFPWFEGAIRERS